MDILRQIVAGPRARHPEAGLDLCYVTDFIVATSGPSGTYPQVAYRNPLKDLVKWLDTKHGAEWAIWEFRAEGTGYPDEEVYNRIRHYPWPDHHPPPFALVPLIMASMRNWLKDETAAAEGKKRVAVVHCKAGKGRSGTVSCSYLISEEGWTPEEAMARFTERRMRPGFGAGISIPSQLRWISYVDRWTKNGKLYVDRQVEVIEVHIWGLRDGVKIAIEGFVDEGKVIKTFHTFSKSERTLLRGSVAQNSGFSDVAAEVMQAMTAKRTKEADAERTIKEAEKISQDQPAKDTTTGGDVIFRPAQRVVLPSSDINIDIERRNKSKYGGFTMVTSVAHVWFNTFFEGRGPEQNGRSDDSGVFNIDFDAMDGIKGSSRKGTRCFDKMSVVWKAADPELKVITEPAEGEAVAEACPADWRGGDKHSDDVEKKLGLREATSASAEVSQANSIIEKEDGEEDSSSSDPAEGTRSHGPTREALTPVNGVSPTATDGGAADDQQSKGFFSRLIHGDGTAEDVKAEPADAVTTDPSTVLNTSDLPDHEGHKVGSVKLSRHVESSS